MTHGCALSEPRLPPNLHMGVLIFSQALSCYLLLQHLPVSLIGCQPSVPFLVGRSVGVPTLAFSPKCGFFVGPESVVGAGAAVTQQGPLLNGEWWQIPWVWKVPGLPFALVTTLLRAAG